MHSWCQRNSQAARNLGSCLSFSLSGARGRIGLSRAGFSSTGGTLGAVLHHVAGGATEHTKLVVYPALTFGGGQLAIITQLVVHVVVSGLSGGRGVTGGVRFGVGVGLVLALGV